MRIDRQVVRQLDMLCMLQKRRYTVTSAELAEEYGKSIRTIQRDLNDLREIGFNIKGERLLDGQQGLFLDPNDLPPMSFALTDLSALIFIESISDFLEGTPFQEHLHDVIQRIEASVPDELVRFLRRAAEAYAPHIRGHKKLDEGTHTTLSHLNRAILEQKICNIKYRTIGSDEEKSYQIEPLRLLYYMEAGGLYLIARVPAYGNPITLAVERIRELDLSDEDFTLEDEVAATISDRLRNSFGIISGEPIQAKIYFSPQQAPYIQERTWHPSQQIEEEEGGGIVITINASDTYELKRWILQFGSDARVLEPKSLRLQIISELKASLDSYQDL